MGDDKDLIIEDQVFDEDHDGSLEDLEWLNSDTYTNYEWMGNSSWTHSPNYSDVETWLIEKSIEANKDQDPNRKINAKRELYLLKCKLERIYDALPKHPEQERDWDKQEVARILKEGK